MHPSHLLFAQHGWKDNNKALQQLVQELAPPHVYVINPRLNWLQTWINILPLIEAVEQQAARTIAQHPHVPVRIIGHSLGGLIWLELLHRHREWWPLVERFTLLGSPVGSSDIARVLDPFGAFPTIARNLGRNRRPLAEEIAAAIPTLTIAGDLGRGSDGVVAEGSTQISGAQHICLAGLSHRELRHHPQVAAAINTFWAGQALATSELDQESKTIVELLRGIPGITDTHERHFARASIVTTCAAGTTTRTWSNPLNIKHVFVAARGVCVYSGFVGWLHTPQLATCLNEINARFGTA